MSCFKLGLLLFFVSSFLGLVLTAPAAEDEDGLTMSMVIGPDAERPGFLESLKKAGIGPKQILDSINRLRELGARVEGGSLLNKILDSGINGTGLVDTAMRLLAVKNTVEDLLMKLLPNSPSILGQKSILTGTGGGSP